MGPLLGPGGEERVDEAEGTDGLAGALGWFSVGLGAAQLLAPDAVSERVALACAPRARAAMRLVGTQELLVGAGLLRGSVRPWFRWSRSGEPVRSVSSPW